MMPRRTTISILLLDAKRFPSPRRGEGGPRSASGEGVRRFRMRGSPSPQPSPRRGEGGAAGLFRHAKRVGVASISILGASLTLSACATPRMHSEAELNSAGLACGLTYGELIQDAEAKKVLILFREAPSADRRRCVYEWARKRHLTLVVIDAIRFPEE